MNNRFNRSLNRINPLATGLLLTVATVTATNASGLLAAWQFDASDVAGSDVSATAGSAANTTGVLQGDAAIVDGALSLDGTGDYLQFGTDVADLRPAGGTMTIAAWVQTDVAITTLRRIVEHEDNTYFWAESGLFQYTTHGTPGNPDGRAQSTTAPAIGVWQHVLVTFAADQPARIYINGVLEGTSTIDQVPIPGNVQSFQIGARRSNSGAATNFWDGLLDDVALWDCELLLADIESLAGVGAGGYPGRTVPKSLGGDSDGDGLPDSYEALYPFLDPNNPDDAALDEDGDGLSNLEEFTRGTRPDLADTDGDSLSDGDEVNDYRTNPLSADTDGDTIADDEELIAGADGFVTDPTKADTDGDGFDDAFEVANTASGFDPTRDDSGGDADGDGLSNGDELLAGTDPLFADSDGDTLSDGDEVHLYGTNPLLIDTDGDFLDDDVEVFVTMTDPTNPDSDGDGLSDGDEVDFYLTDPKLADSDGDGFNDGVEIASDTDPLDGDDFPSVNVLGDLLVYYTFDAADINGDTIADKAGDPAGPFDGTKANGGPSGVAGLFGDAAEFLGGANNGDWEYISLDAHVASLAGLTEGTIAAWVKVPAAGLLSDVLTIFALSDPLDASSETRFWVSNGGSFGTGTLAYGVRNDGAGLGSMNSGSQNPLLDGEWHHVAVSYSATTFTARLFIDGMAVASGASAFFADVTGASSASVGRNKDSTPGGGQWYFDGTMDDFAIWSRALNGAEIAAIHAQGLGGDPLLTPGPAEGPRITKVERVAATNTITITFSSIAGRSYGLEFSTNLIDWDPIDDDVAAGVSSTFSDSFANQGKPVGFYRVRRLD